MDPETGSPTAGSVLPPGLPTCMRLPGHSRPITDADEEVFFLYTRLAGLNHTDNKESESDFRGLGFVDASRDVLPIRLEISPRLTSVNVSTDADAETTIFPHTLTRKSKRKEKQKRREGPKLEPIVLEWELWQDKTSLRSRSGDTGSILWRASIDFATLVLQQTHFPYSGSLFDPLSLKSTSVLELGAGTGLLACALGPLCARYVATDIPALMPLLRKNITSICHGTPVSACTLDWSFPSSRQLPDDILHTPSEIILAVDCIYHPSLVPPLLDTIAALCRPGATATAVLVVSELRAEDVVRTFLDAWLARRDEGWTIWSVNGEGEDALLGARYAMWLGWRTTN